MAFNRWLYRGGRPNQLSKIMNKGWAFLHTLGIFPSRLVTLEVAGRQSGKPIRFPLVMTTLNRERYLVSMLGKEANWVQNIRAANGHAQLLHGIHEQVILKQIDVAQRAPIIKAFLQIAPGARPHFSISQDAPIAEFEKIAPDYPVFRIESVNRTSAQ